MMSDKLNGIFDQGFSGIIHEGKRKSTMPNYLEQLAEREATLINPDIVTPIDLDFNFSMGLERAAELNNDECRTVESRKVKAKDFRKEIETAVEGLLSEGQEPQDIEKILNRKFPPPQVKRFFEANSSEILTKYSELVPSFIGYIPYKISREIDVSLQEHKSRLKTESSIKVCSSFFSYLKSVKSSLRKTDVEQKVAFRRDNDKQEMKERLVDNNKSKNDRTTNEASVESMLKEFKISIQSGLSKKEIHQKLAKKHPVKLIEDFYSKYASEINKFEKFVNRENFDTDFKKITVNANDKDVRDFENEITESQKKIMLNYASKSMSQGKSLEETKVALKKVFNLKHANKFIESNKNILEKIAKDSSLTLMLQEFKTFAKAGSSKKDISLKLAKKYSADLIKNFYSKFASEISKIEKSVGYECFNVDSKKISVNANNKSFEDFESKIPEYQEKQMLNFAFSLMSQGKKLEEIKEAVKKSFNFKNAKKFLETNTKTLEKHYGQLGYVFMDSNVYTNCDEMKKAHHEVCAIGKQLMYSVKANKKCNSCVDNKCGTCSKVGLMISNHPLVRSSRAAKRVLAKASSFVPKSYIDKFSSKITEDGNMKLISEFSLGINAALDNERKNIGKKASRVDGSADFRKGFEVVENVDVDFFSKSNKSSIIDNVLKTIKN
jgi:hypothetical protein